MSENEVLSQNSQEINAAMAIEAIKLMQLWLWLLKL
jgi:hypothetical protein